MSGLRKFRRAAVANKGGGRLVQELYEFERFAQARQRIAEHRQRNLRHDFWKYEQRCWDAQGVVALDFEAWKAAWVHSLERLVLLDPLALEDLRERGLL